MAFCLNIKHFAGAFSYDWPLTNYYLNLQKRTKVKTLAQEHRHTLDSLFEMTIERCHFAARLRRDE